MGKRKKRWGDRWDAYRLKGLDPMHTLFPFIYGGRTQNEAVLGEVMDLTEVDKYLEKKNASNPDFKYTWFHFIVAALAKTVYLRPKMNYFISGSHFYEHKNIDIAFIVKRRFADDDKEALAKFVLDREGGSPVEQVHSYLEKIVTHVRKKDSGDVGIDKSMNIISSIPTIILRWLIAYFKHMQRHGFYPKSLAQDDPCYSSVFVTNLGSIKMNADYHHLSEWGTNSFFVVVGEKKLRPFFKEDGSYELRNTIKLGLTLDERIADGYYYAKSLRLVRKIFEHPELLDLPASEPIEID